MSNTLFDQLCIHWVNEMSHESSNGLQTCPYQHFHLHCNELDHLQQRVFLIPVNLSSQMITGGQFSSFTGTVFKGLKYKRLLSCHLGSRLEIHFPMYCVLATIAAHKIQIPTDIFEINLNTQLSSLTFPLNLNCPLNVSMMASIFE